MDYQEICRLSIICKSWYRIAFDNRLWKQLCVDRWGPNLLDGPKLQGKMMVTITTIW